MGGEKAEKKGGKREERRRREEKKEGIPTRDSLPNDEELGCHECEATEHNKQVVSNFRVKKCLYMGKERGKNGGKRENEIVLRHISIDYLDEINQNTYFSL